MGKKNNEKIIHIKDVLLTPEELYKHAKEIAKNHDGKCSPKAIKHLVKRLNENYERISYVYKELDNNTYVGQDLSPASQWLLDNFYKIEEQVQEVEYSLSTSKFLKLEILNSGSLSGYPRAYAIAYEYISHTDGKLEEKVLVNYVKEYQQKRVLNINEIWSLSLMLRCALIENIRVICEYINNDYNQWIIAEETVKRNNSIIDEARKKIVIDGELNLVYIEHLMKLLRRSGIETGEIVNYLQIKLKDYNTSVQRVIEEEHKEQAASKIAIGNCLTSLNIVSTLDWNSIFEELSIVEEILRNDPCRIYQTMDFESRDYYRNAIEEISKSIKECETRVARKALECAQEAHMKDNDKTAHIGYYLIDKGRKILHKKLDHENIKDKFQSKHLTTYLFPMFLITLVTILIVICCSSGIISTDLFLLFIITLVIFVPASEIGVTITNYFFTNYYKPKYLPRVEYEQGLSEEVSTLVVVPALLPNEKRIEEIIDDLEVYYLANKDSFLYFAIAGDFVDSFKEELSDDKAIVNNAITGIERLNKKYGSNKFYYFHRKRVYYEKEKKWMGWERKRGALMELNKLLLGSKDTSYFTTIGDIENLKKVRYMITIDADTQLTLGTAKKLIGIASHPLNRPVLDKNSRKVVEGYGLIQPRIGIDIESANKSFFTKIYAGHGGIDTYSASNSNVYQDLFDIGIFTGKGIYDINVFDKILGEAIPDNAILSHDLLEGSYVRTGLATDLELIDGFPTKYNSYIARNHRWTRGDWQLIPWLFKKVKDTKGQKVNNPLSALNKWHIIDNMRRSLVPIGLFITIILGLLVMQRSTFVILFVIFTLFFPLCIKIIDYYKNKYYKTIKERLHADLIIGIKSTLYQVTLNFIFLPYESYIMTDAILRTLYRVFISKENLVVWVTAADAEKKLDNSLVSYFRKMKSSIIISSIIIILTYYFAPHNFFYAALLGMIWCNGPLIAFHISKEKVEVEESIDEKSMAYLKKIARKTWAYYEDFVSDDNNFLPPDNFQIFNSKGIANRTSPTNIGIYLISILSARDLGYITTSEMINRINKTINTVGKMDKWRGHLYNWYQSNTLEILRPYYVSTVDSGNLVSYLITVKEGLNEYLQRPLFDKNIISGLLDTLNLSEDDRNDIKNDFETMLKNDFDLYKMISIIKTYNVSEDMKSIWEVKFKETIIHLKKDIKDYIYTDDNHEELLLDNLSLVELQQIYKKMLINTKEYNEETEELYRIKNSVDMLIEKCKKTVNKINDIIQSTQFIHLYNPKRNLFSIGYNVEEEKLTNSYYDLLASEARVASYLAIAFGEVPKKHWFKLGRSISVIDGYRGLVSWTGTMFEYFMPYILMKNYQNTLLDESYGTVLQAQREYSYERCTPWGISECGYYSFDMAFNYQYRAFGVPSLGYKRGLSKEVVISPYSTFLALPFSPKEAMKNIKILVDEGMEGKYGFYEAIDYTPQLNFNKKNAQIIESFMTHHQGMILNSINNMCNNFIMQKRFHNDPIIKVGEILLQEKIPLKLIVSKKVKEEIKPIERIAINEEKLVRTYSDLDVGFPHCHILSSGRYNTLITNSGTGYSRLDNLQITRWRKDALSGKYGSFIFIRHLNSNNIWSTFIEPIKKEPDAYKVVFSPDKAEYFRTDENLDSHTEIIVSPEDDVEIRKVTITNHGTNVSNIEVTSYLEVVLTSQEGDLAHPAFSNLFVRTEVQSEYESLIAYRRPREEKQDTKWIFHSVMVEEDNTSGFQYETNREAFIGRGRDLSNSVAFNQPLRDTSGIVLDPIMSLRKVIAVSPGTSRTIYYISGVDESKEKVIGLIKKYRDTSTIWRAFELAVTRSQIELNYLNIEADEIKLYQEMISQIIYLNPLREKYKDIIMRNTKSQKDLWAYGISGDVPIVLVTIKNLEDIFIIKNLLKAHEYWRMKGLKVDVIILNQEESDYYQPLNNLIMDVVFASSERYTIDQVGGIFIRKADIFTNYDKELLFAVANIIIKAENGDLRSQVYIHDNDETLEISNVRIDKSNHYDIRDEQLKLQFFNGYGGFSKDGREYTVLLNDNINTPAPWINVIANKKFGFTISERGAGFTWCENSRENKLTPWTNDFVTDESGEIIYLKDNTTKLFWTITPSPIRSNGSYIIDHGMGYTRFKHDTQGIIQEQTVFVAENDPIKISRIKLKNVGNICRTLSLTYYIRPVMGVNEQNTEQYIITEMDDNNNSIYIRNPFNSEYNNKLSFITSSEEITSFCCDRRDFIGVRGDVKCPQGMLEELLTNKVGGGYDPCVAIQISIDLDKEEEKELVFLLGQVENKNEAIELINKFKNVEYDKKELINIKKYWNNLVETIQVKTPDPSFDLLLNGWLLYQTVSCRLWARSAFYQSGGAYGFRDQLQDAMNIVYTLPKATKDQILLHCSHQFVEGDVQHWWHPGPEGKGIRTRFSDDLLWLPYAVIRYVTTTEDNSILYEQIPYLEEEVLKEGEDERYGTPQISSETGTVYEHCIRAIEKGLNLGDKGIPLIGSGDWNDGMNTVGNKGKGQSVWLGWFLTTILMGFEHICNVMKDKKNAQRYNTFRKEIVKSIENNAWDGEWYIRAFYDNGKPLGSSQNIECKIDSLAQSWAVISKGGDKDRIIRAMRSVEEYLIKKSEGLILLFTPPFDNSEQSPGYIKGYVPGVRENGGQYTHAASWVIKAFATLGDGDKAWELYNLINPINHSRTHLECSIYKVEPYVIAADVYAVNPHVGRGGWSWYTGVAGWMYSVGVEDILGLKKKGDKLFIEPCVPKQWEEYSIRYRFKEALYIINISNKNKESNHDKILIRVDGTIQQGYIPLKDDKDCYNVEVEIQDK
ncbi:MAG: GH36-type glycosyl hydrolase domain-containing protein [Eubacteriaceae bacterium]